RRDVEGDAIERHDAAEADRDVAHAEQRRAAGGSRSCHVHASFVRRLIQRSGSAKLPLPPKHLRPFCGIVVERNDGLITWTAQLKWRRAMFWARWRRSFDPQRGR